MMSARAGDLLIVLRSTYIYGIGLIKSGDLMMTIDVETDGYYALIMTQHGFANACRTGLAQKIKMKDIVFHRVENG